MTAPVPARSRICYLNVTQQAMLRDWGVLVCEMFQGVMPYQVGSTMYRQDWRDVDVRLMLPLGEFLTLGDLISLKRLNLTVSLWGQQVTGLPIDFQVQEADAANAEFDGMRKPIGMQI